VRIVIANPPGFGGPDYDHHLCSALAAEGEDVELVTTRFRFGAMPEPDGYRRSLLFYPLSARVFGRSRLRVPVKVAEHPIGMLQLAARRADVVHVQWLSIPEIDRYLLRSRSPLVYTAHDHTQRRTAGKTRMWSEIYARFERIVAHSESGRRALAAQGIPEHKLRVIPHPIIRSDPPRTDDGRTLLCFGLIRPYKGIDDAIEVTRLVDGAHLLVAGDPMEPVEGYQRQAGDLAEWRLGYLPQAEVDRAYGDATLAIFPYRPGLDQSGTLLRALGAGVPAVAYDVGGLGENVSRFGAGRVVPAGDVEAMAAAVRELLDDPDALAAARRGALAARDALTWPASARMHIELYRELLGGPSS
jgi:glycosyltransferase involved in cell wall biosynthesis